MTKRKSKKANPATCTHGDGAWVQKSADGTVSTCTACGKTWKKEN